MEKSNVEWARFRNPESGEEYIIVNDDCIAYFCDCRVCDYCVVNEHIKSKEYENCSDWIKDHPLEAAKGMGYEFVCRKWKDGRMETREDLEKEEGEVGSEGNSEENSEDPFKELPFLCRWLKMKPGTVIRVNGWDWLIEKDGTLSFVNGGRVWFTECQALYKILEYPELVEVVQNGLMEEEKETLEWLRKFLPSECIVRPGEGDYWLEIMTGEGKFILRIKRDLFPSLKQGWTLFVDGGELVMDREG